MIDEDTLERLRDDHAGEDLYLLSSRDAAIVVRKPTRPEYKRFRAQSADPAKRDIAMESLVKSVLVHPSAKEFDALLDRLPALCEEFAGEVLEFAGMAGEAESRKL